MTEPVKVKQLHYVTDAMQFTDVHAGIEIVKWVCKAHGHAQLAWDSTDANGNFEGLRLFVGANSFDPLSRADVGDWVVQDPFKHFRAVDLSVFEYTHEVVEEA